MIKNVIFDLGNVVYDYQPLNELLKMGYSKEKAISLLKSIFAGPVWREMDRGQFTVMEGVEKLCEQFPEIADDIRRILTFEWLDNLMVVMQPTIDFFHEVKKQGYKTFVLSNFGLDSFEFMRKRDAEFFDEMDGIVVSSLEKLVKPDPAIFNRLLERYSLVPQESVFIDDTKENIEAAESLGIYGILFTGIEECKNRFESIIKGATV